MQIFGPVLVVGVFKTEEEGIALANNTTYGLGAGLHSSTCFFRISTTFEKLTFSTDDASQCMRVSSALEAGTVSVCTPQAVRSHLIEAFSQVWVNQYNILNNNVPFGGKKQSGIGKC